MTRQPTATIYRRFSSLEQSRGDSLRRQWETNSSHCELRGWEIVEDISDEGLSAYHGSNRKDGGSLYEFERRVVAGHFRGSAFHDHRLVVEHLDRISRQGWQEVYAFLERCTTNGVTVVTTMDSKVFEAGRKPDMGSVIEIIVRAESAWQQSEDKARRVSAAWDKKQAAAKDGSRKALTTRAPSWLKVSESREYELDTARVSVLNDVFGWAADGMGSPAIARRLNERGVPTFGDGKTGWQQAFISQLLTDRRVLGEYQRYRRIRKPHRLEPVGEPISDFYPQAVTASLFNRVQAARAERKGTGGKRGRTNANLFMGIARCRHCGGRMTYNSTRKAGDVIHGQSGSRKPLTFVAKVSNSTLRCDNASRRVRDGEGRLLCQNRSTIRYEYIERGILDRLLYLALDNVYFLVPDRAASIEVEIAEIERRVEHRKGELANLAQALAERFSTTLVGLVEKLEGEQEAEAARLEELRSDLAKARGEVTTDEHLARVKAVREALDDPDPDVRLDARIRVNQALRQIVTSMTCDAEKVTTVEVARGLATLRFNAKGEVDERNRGKVRVMRKEFQLEGLRAVEGNSGRVEDVLRRHDRQRLRA